MLDKVNILCIWRDHLDTLRDFGTGERRGADVMLFFATPMLVVTLAIVIHGPMDGTEVAILITAFSIFAALLLNLLLLIFGLVRRNKSSDDVLADQRIELLRETYSNISFCILISIAAIALLLLYLLDSRHNFVIPGLDYLMSSFVYYMTTVFLLTLVMVLKRVHILLSKEIEDAQSDG